MKQLSTGLCKAIFTFFILIACRADVRSQVVYHNVQPDTTLSMWGNFVFAPFGHGAGASYLNIWTHPSPDVILVSYNEFEVLRGTNGWPARLDAGAAINATGTWDTAFSAPLNNNGAGHWQSNAVGKFLGFRVKQNNAWHYGWIKLSVYPGPDSFTVHEWAYNAAGQPINAGQTVATSITDASGDTPLLCYAQGRIKMNNAKPGQRYRFSITDMSGRVLEKGEYTAGQEIEVRTLPAGMYLFTTIANNEVVCLKFVVE